MTVIARSALGWTIEQPQPYGVTRPSPLRPVSGNPRNLRYRSNDVADLLAGVYWYVHTGNAGQYPDVLVTQAHSQRALTAGFGTNNSDHKALTAIDLNWSAHPWRQAAGMTRAIYDAHMASPAHANAHRVFAAVDARLGMVRWCGRPWQRSDGAGYYEQHRDCMHWVVESPNATSIRAAADRMRAHFVPPKTVEEIKSLQRYLGLTADGEWAAVSIAAMRRWQKSKGLPTTGLPGDVATRRAMGSGTSGSVTALPRKAPKSSVVRAGSPVALVKIVQGLLGVEQDGSYGNITKQAVVRKQASMGVTADGVWGPNTWRAYLATVGTRRRGSTGWSVRFIQYIGGLTVDGHYGPATETRVKEMQRWAGLTADGIFGPASRAKLII